MFISYVCYVILPDKEQFTLCQLHTLRKVCLICIMRHNRINNYKAIFSITNQLPMFSSQPVILDNQLYSTTRTSNMFSGWATMKWLITSYSVDLLGKYGIIELEAEGTDYSVVWLSHGKVIKDLSFSPSNIREIKV